MANPDVPSVRNAQRLLDRIGQLGSCRDRVRLLLNRAAEPCPIPPAQIESALGHPIHHTFPSDYKTVSAALNSGVPVALSGNSAIAEQFDRFTRRFINRHRRSAGGAVRHQAENARPRTARINVVTPDGNICSTSADNDARPGAARSSISTSAPRCIASCSTA